MSWWLAREKALGRKFADYGYAFYETSTVLPKRIFGSKYLIFDIRKCGGWGEKRRWEESLQTMATRPTPLSARATLQWAKNMPPIYLSCQHLIFSQIQHTKTNTKKCKNRNGQHICSVWHKKFWNLHFVCNFKMRCFVLDDCMEFEGTYWRSQMNIYTRLWPTSQ